VNPDGNKQAAKRLDEEEDSFFGGLAKTILTFGLYSGNLNAGEDVERWVAKQVKEIRADAIAQAMAATDGLSFEEEDDDDDLLPVDPVGALLKAATITAIVDASLGIDDAITQK
jgi:Ca2+-binding RTX toxin-like protein